MTKTFESKLELVKDISELKPGVRIKTLGCEFCNNNHYYICLDFISCEAYSADLTLSPSEGIQVIPESGCMPDLDVADYDIVESAQIKEGRVYKFIDLEDKEEDLILRQIKSDEAIAKARITNPCKEVKIR